MSIGTSMGGRGAANEVLREGLAGDMLAQHRMVQEISLLEEAWQRISTNGAVAYGMADIQRATEEGAVETLSSVPMSCEALTEVMHQRGRTSPQKWRPFQGPSCSVPLTTMRVNN